MIDTRTSWHPLGSWHRLQAFGGARIHVVRPSPGAGPPLLLIHGFAQSSWAWRFVLPVLAGTTDPIAVCLPGLGWSDKPAAAAYDFASQAERLLELLDQLGVARVHLCGGSMGGALALWLAATAPERVDRVVLVGPAADRLFPAALLADWQHEAWAPLWHLPGFDQLLRLGLSHGAYQHLPVDDHYMAHFLAPLRATGGVTATLRVARAFRPGLRALDQRLGDVRAPVLLIRGARDYIVPLSVARHIAGRVPQTRIVEYARCGHCPQEEEPGRFAGDVRGFLTEAA